MQDKRDTESVVQEIMGLVDDIISCDSPTYQFECKREIRSKLCKLAESKLSVWEPLDAHEVGCLIETAAYLSTEHQRRADFINGIRYAERAHNITNTSKE